MRHRSSLLALLIAVVPALAHALAPHELVVLANEAVPASVEIAESYAARRGVPAANVLRVHVPLDAAGAVPVEIDQATFGRRIWAPLQEAMRSRGIAEHIQACVYSVGFPIRVGTRPAVSITGLSFLRNRMPSEIQVTRGLYVSPLFAGPTRPGEREDPSVSLATSLEWLGAAPEDRPFPAMMLGYLGARGNTRAEVEDGLRRSAAADATRPAGTVYFVTSDDIRSTTRAWQFPAVARALGKKHVAALITNDYPRTAQIVGLMSGSAHVRPADYGQYAPGSVCDHFTSFAAAFDIAAQDKLSRWLAAGAASSSGTVTEPYSVWTKIPHARFYEHYAAGCTLLESYFLSVRSPLQLLALGDPLLSPWHRGDELALQGLPAGPVRGTLKVEAQVTSRTPLAYRHFEVFIDGRRVGGPQDQGHFQIDLSALTPGTHELYLTSRRAGLVHHPVFARASFRVAAAP